MHRPEHPTLSTQWLAGAQQMDGEAWSRLVHVFAPIVYRWCRTSGVPADDASDVVQEVFISVARGIPAFERRKVKGSFRSWLASITRSRAADYFRNAVKQQHAAGGTAAMLALQQHLADVDSTVTQANAERLLPKQLLKEIRCEFESKTWDAFWRTTIDGQSAAEVSEATGLSRASVYQAKSRVLKLLRQRLAELADS